MKGKDAQRAQEIHMLGGGGNSMGSSAEGFDGNKGECGATQPRTLDERYG